ncbi:uncharacterized protein LOC122378413 [Amphibalanus amphitrite]|uniref:uncharacterized protein LOC122378413 n=1 Tax=Amphibalanus amphitrite TaxID=1232801 RepID=UPI001C924171|nr:uncharacterized protein LOC122378413 [Amphibalanus amphitrite]
MIGAAHIRPKMRSLPFIREQWLAEIFGRYAAATNARAAAPGRPVCSGSARRASRRGDAMEGAQLITSEADSQSSSHDRRGFRIPLAVGRLPQRLSGRTTVLLVALLAGSMLLLHSAGSGHMSPAALGQHYSRIRSAAHSQLRSLLGSSSSEPLSSVYCSQACPCACRPWRRPEDGEPPEPIVSNCGPTADRRGARQNVLAYTFFGTNVSAYLSGIERNAMRSLEFYPGWTMRVFHDGKDSSAEWNKTACEVTCQFPNVDFCDVRRLPGLGDISSQTATVWRFAVIADESVERFVMRDLDSILTKRERDAVNEWLESNKTFHVMRDHPWHGAEILAGMWGGWNRYNGKYRILRQQMLKAVNPSGKLWWDQRLLRTVLWPELVRTGDVMSHDSYQCQNFPLTQPYPTKRANLTEFVGSQYTRVTLTVQKECPMACRPRRHMDWKYC